MINHSGWQVQGIVIDPVAVLLGLAAVLVLALIALIVVIWRSGSRRAQAEAAQLDASRIFETEVAELKGRLQTMAELSVTRQSELSRTINERLDRIGQNLGTNIEETTRKTSENLTKLHERLAVIDNAQRNITELSTRVVSLQDILANKQQRGAFGQLRMESIIQDGLPSNSYTFQATLSNGKRPDCLVHLPGAAAGIVIDAKFPLEGFEAFRTARGPEAKKDAARRVRVDVTRHVDAMSERYFLPGETQDTAILFVPSEAIYADLAEHFSDLVQKAHRARIVICAPNMLMLAVQTMQAILKDVQMREQAHLIQREVTRLMEDMGRLRERVLDLQRHFGQANQDIEKILTSSERIAARGAKIENLEFEAEAQEAVPNPKVTPLAAASQPAAKSNGDGREPAGRQPDLLVGHHAGRQLAPGRLAKRSAAE
jgi:DNA recombination protein RmuC